MPLRSTFHLSPGHLFKAVPFFVLFTIGNKNTFTSLINPPWMETGEFYISAFLGRPRSSAHASKEVHYARLCLETIKRKRKRKRNTPQALHNAKVHRQKEYPRNRRKRRSGCFQTETHHNARWVPRVAQSLTWQHDIIRHSFVSIVINCLRHGFGKQVHS